MIPLSELVSDFQSSLTDPPPAPSDPEALLSNPTDTLALSPEQVSEESIFSALCDLCFAYPSLPRKCQQQLVYIISSSACTFSEVCAKVLENLDTESFLQARGCVLAYAFLLHVILIHLSNQDLEFQGMGKKGTRPGSDLVKLFKENSKQVEICLDACAHILRPQKLGLLFETTPELDFFVSLMTRPTYTLMELEARIKVDSIKRLMFKVITLAVTYHNHLAVAQEAVVQNLTYFIHLTSPMAELLASMAESQPALVAATLRDVSEKEFDANDNNGPKAVSQFLVKLLELCPSLVLGQMVLVATLLDNSAQSLRCAVVETCGNIIVSVSGQERHAAQVEQLLDLIQDRMCDMNPFVRLKAAQALARIAELEGKYVPRRQAFLDLAVRGLDDKSALVRKHCIKLVTKLVLNHPFSAIHGTSLSLKVWESRLQEAESVLENMGATSNESSENAENDSTQGSNTVSTHSYLKVKLTIKYYEDAIKFIETLERCAARTAKLLHSRNKGEVLEAMDFFVLADAYNIENAQLGIRKMLHLVWMKGTSDDGTDITAHLFECYQSLFLTAPLRATALEAAAYVAKNLITLTYRTSAADLASLEKLLLLMYQEGLIDNTVVKILWQIYSNSIGKGFSQRQRRGAIAILGMIALANHEVALRHIDQLLAVILLDDMELARYTCIALQRVGKLRGPKESEAIERLKMGIKSYTEDPQWYPFAEQAINAIYIVGGRPDIVMGEVIRSKMVKVFQENMDVEGDVDMDSAESGTIALSQLLFIVGHVAIKTMVHLEMCEAEFKKKKIAAETASAKQKEKDELEMIGGTTEDDFADAVNFVKEQELLFGENSLLARFGPLVQHICLNSAKFDHPMLQRNAALCMEKLMCVSSQYCEQNLGLLLTLMERSSDPIIRSNAVLGLGDMAVCFNNLVDENTNFLYRRLDDDNIMVQRTCLMTVTFLILAGQVKVKGQLATMAKCLENQDDGIADMCRLFFTELALKDNAIYNGFIDIFSGLSNDPSLAKDSMKRILRFLIGFIEKEKQQKLLSEKLLTRLNKAGSEEEWKDVAFVLQTLPIKLDNVVEAVSAGYRMVGQRK